jgi:hypothetical protein
MNLKSWSSRQIFHPVSSNVQPREAAECRGQLTVSMTAGEDRLHRLSDEHLRAIFTAARVDRRNDGQTGRDPNGGVVHTATEAWVAAFKQDRPP